MNSILTVTGPASSYDLTALATVKTELSIVGSGDDTKIDGWIRQASSAIAKYCNRVFAKETVSEQFRLVRCIPKLTLSRRPISSITSILEDEVETVLVNGTDYEYDSLTGEVWRLTSDDARTHWGASKIVVVYQAGYTLLSELPYEVERAAILLVKYYRFSAKRDPFIRSETADGIGRTDYGFGGMTEEIIMPPDVASLISPYRELVV